VSQAAVIEVDPHAEGRWDAFVADHPEGTVYHGSGWLAALAAEYRRSRQLMLACEAADGSLRGILPLQFTRGLALAPRGIGGRRLASLPRTPLAGPLALDDSASAALLAEAARRASADRAELQVKTAAPLPPAAHPAGAVTHPWRESFVIELPADEGELRFGNSRNHSRIRWAVNRGRKAGVRVREAASEADVRRWYPTYLEALRSHAVPPRPLRLFLGRWRELRPRGEMTLLLAEDRHAEVIGGSVLLESGATSFYAFNGVVRRHLDARPNDVVQWEAIHRAVRAGRRRYDLGEVVERHVGLADFKRKWGASAVRLHRLYLPAPSEPPDPGDREASGLRHAAESAYERLPLRATAVAGDAIYRFL
jgi:CelD/BcsL family acetyltransferase involved in cellulose biosynthesis